MERVLVFCGSSPGRQPAYRAAAEAVGTAIARRGLGLVYGGASVGLMGAVADAALAGGGEVIGVIPRALEAHEIAHRNLSELRVVETMHERKALMLELSDAAVALPGGAGTLDEFFEAFTWAQLGYHTKPLALFDVDAYWQGLLAFLDHAVAERMIRAEHLDTLIVEGDAERLLDRFAAPTAPAPSKWLDRDA